jgi:hypothetical protein
METNIHGILKLNTIDIHSIYEIEYLPSGATKLHNFIAIKPSGEIFYIIDTENFKTLLQVQLLLNIQQSRIDNVTKTLVLDVNKIIINNTGRDADYFPYTSIILNIQGTLPYYQISRTLNNATYDQLQLSQNTMYCKLLTFNLFIYSFNRNIQVNSLMISSIKSQGIRVFYKDIIEHIPYNQIETKRYYYCLCFTNEQLQYMQTTYKYIGETKNSNLEFMNNYFIEI